jgi:type II secretory pathway component PulK
MVPGLTLEEARALASTRAQSPFRSLKEFEARLPRATLKWIEGTLSIDSGYFMVRGRATVGKADVRMEALLQRERGSMPVVLWQRMR